MGEARRRGNAQERRLAAIKRDKELLREYMGGKDEHSDVALRTGLAPFLERISPDEWQARRSKILERLKTVTIGAGLENAKPIRVREDEIGWYLFLCEQTLEDPLCTDISQAQRILPFFAGIGERWAYSPKVKGIEKKIDEILHKYKNAPDGLIFEILVALSYAAKGWDVELLDQKPPAKSPDMVARMEGQELYIECKRQERRAAYAETERNEFLRLWDAAKDVLVSNRQWVWCKGTFHVEASSLPLNFLRDILEKSLPLGPGETLIHNNNEATIYARLIDQFPIHRHLEKYRVKTNSPALNSLLGGDWAPANASVTIAKMVKTSHIVDCEAPVLGTYIEEIGWACGFTREFDSDVSIEKKARDVTRHLADAVKQVPNDKPSIIHIAAETLEGKDVEHRRTQKIFETIPSFVVDKPVLAVRFHRFQSNQSADKLYEFDETVDQFQIDGVSLDEIIPLNVVIPDDVEMRSGSHWELYP